MDNIGSCNTNKANKIVGMAIESAYIIVQVAQTINDIHQLSKLSQLNNISGMLLHLCMWN